MRIAPTAWTTSDSRWHLGGSSAGAATSHTANGS